ncbi:MAG: cell division protein FtsH, partial [Acidaminococcaceae bacterium]
AAQIDGEVLEIIKAAHSKARQILVDNQDKLHELAAHLLEKETITGTEFMAILNREQTEQAALVASKEAHAAAIAAESEHI